MPFHKRFRIRKGKPAYYGKLQIGHFRNDGTFVIIKKPKHYFVKYKGFGINERLLTHLLFEQCKKIRIIYQSKKGDQIIDTTPQQWFDKGTQYTNDYNTQEGEQQETQRILKWEK